MELLPLAFTSGWASGLNAYATVLALGLVGRIGHFAEIPAGLQRTDVLIVAAVLFVIEAVADKIPYFDSVWDTISTVIRPVVGAVIGALLAGGQGDLWTITLAATGGITALVTHLVKATTRLAINTSPEPVTNIAASFGEDFSAVGVASLAVLAPIPMAIIAAVLLGAGIWLVWFFSKRIKRGWAAFQSWRSRHTPAPRQPSE